MKPTETNLKWTMDFDRKKRWSTNDCLMFKCVHTTSPEKSVGGGKKAGRSYDQIKRWTKTEQVRDNTLKTCCFFPIYFQFLRIIWSFVRDKHSHRYLWSEVTNIFDLNAVIRIGVFYTDCIIVFSNVSLSPVHLIFMLFLPCFHHSFISTVTSVSFWGS